MYDYIGFFFFSFGKISRKVDLSVFQITSYYYEFCINRVRHSVLFFFFLFRTLNSCFITLSKWIVFVRTLVIDKKKNKKPLIKINTQYLSIYIITIIYTSAFYIAEQKRFCKRSIARTGVSLYLYIKYIVYIHMLL